MMNKILYSFLFLQIILGAQLVPLSDLDQTRPFGLNVFQDVNPASLVESVTQVDNIRTLETTTNFGLLSESTTVLETFNKNETSRVGDNQLLRKSDTFVFETSTVSLVSNEVPVTVQSSFETTTIFETSTGVSGFKFLGSEEQSLINSKVSSAFSSETTTTTTVETLLFTSTTTSEAVVPTTVNNHLEETSTVKIIEEITQVVLPKTFSNQNSNNLETVTPFVGSFLFTTESTTIEPVTMVTEMNSTTTTTTESTTTTEAFTTTTTPESTTTTTESTTTTTEATTTTTPESTTTTTESTTTSTESTTTTTESTTTTTIAEATTQSTTTSTTTESTTTTTESTTTTEATTTTSTTESTTTTEAITTTPESTTTTTEDTTTTTTEATTTTTTEATTSTTTEATTTTTTESTTKKAPLLTTTTEEVSKNETQEIQESVDKIKFEVKNYTILSNNSFEPNSYSLRIRIKGFKWNEKFSNVSSNESQELLKSKILPLLYKSLNLNPSEINEVKLLKLFKGSIQSDLVFKSNSTLNLNITSRLFDFNSSEPRMIENVFETKNITEMTNDHISINEFNITVPLNKTEKFQYDLNFNLKIVATVSFLDQSSLENSIEQLLKHAVLKHFDGKLKKLEVKVLNISYAHENCTQCLFPIKLKVLFKSFFELTAKEITDALNEVSINKNKCSIDHEKQTVECVSVLKDSSSLLRLSDYWIDLETVPVHHALFSLDDLLSYNPEWIIGLGIIGCILAIFFVGCIIAICYTRRPYRRSSKIYELESAVRKNSGISHIPSMYPATRAQPVPKHKEVYY